MLRPHIENCDMVLHCTSDSLGNTGARLSCGLNNGFNAVLSTRSGSRSPQDRLSRVSKSPALNDCQG